MTQPTPATQPTLTDLLAGVIDLGAGARPRTAPARAPHLRARLRRRGSRRRTGIDAGAQHSTAVIEPGIRGAT